MGSITQLNDRIRPVPQSLLTDDQVRAAIDQLEASGAVSTSLLEAAGRIGLLAVSVPSEFGGADLPNDLIADLLAATARLSPEAAAPLATHFVALELLRTSGTFEQRRGVYSRVVLGERFRCPSLDLADAAFQSDGIGLRLAPSIPLPDSQGEDWTVLVVADSGGKPGVVLISTAAHLDSVAAAARDPASPAPIHLPADNFLALGGDSQTLAGALATLLDAAITLGVLARASDGNGQFADFEAIEPGARSVYSELLKAMIARLAGMIDALQVGANTVAPGDLAGAIAALESLTRRVRDGHPL